MSKNSSKLKETASPSAIELMVAQPQGALDSEASKTVVKLANFKVAHFASEETLCFEASLWINGKKAGTVSNEGRGGCCDIHISRDKMEILEAYCKTLPPDLSFDFLDDDETARKLEYEPDFLMAVMAGRMDMRKYWQTQSRKKTFYRQHGHEYKAGEWHTFGRKLDDRMLAHAEEKYGDEISILKPQAIDLDDDEDFLLMRWHAQDRTRRIVSIERTGPVFGDFRVDYTFGTEKHKASGWIPLMMIKDSTWPEFAEMSDYPEMVAAGDWSGIRDSSKTSVWQMFAELRKQWHSKESS